MTSDTRPALLAAYEDRAIAQVATEMNLHRVRDAVTAPALAPDALTAVLTPLGPEDPLPSTGYAVHVLRHLGYPDPTIVVGIGLDITDALGPDDLDLLAQVGRSNLAWSPYATVRDHTGLDGLTVVRVLLTFGEPLARRCLEAGYTAADFTGHLSAGTVPSSDEIDLLIALNPPA